MVLCIEPQKIYSPGGCHKIALLSTFLHNRPQPNNHNQNLPNLDAALLSNLIVALGATHEVNYAS
jgi:hypothetical protein